MTRPGQPAGVQPCTVHLFSRGCFSYWWKGNLWIMI